MDITNLIKHYIRELGFDVLYHHVHAHLKEVLRWDQLTEIQKLNVECDTLAKEALLNGIVDQEFISSHFPFEDIVLNCGGKKATGSPTTVITRGGSNTALTYFIARESSTGQTLT